jgi:Uma2 family endonuclease
MSTVSNRQIPVAEYLDFERASETRHEYYAGQVFAMTGASADHNWITGNLEAALRERLRGAKCRPYSRDMRVCTSESGLFTYPDIVVACPPEFRDDRLDTIINPQVVIEVLSPTTESYDRGKKFDLYREAASLKQYVLVAQDSVRIMSYVRQSDGVAWLMNPLERLDQALGLPTLNVSIPLSEIYRDAEFLNDTPSPPTSKSAD